MLAATGAGLLGYSMFFERTAISVTKLELTFKKLPKAFDGYKILQLSDLHVAHWWTLEKRMEKLMSQVDYDLLTLTGDVAVTARGAKYLKAFLDRVHPKDGTVAVFGNTEHKGEYGLSRQADMHKMNMTILENDHLFIERGDDRVAIIGVDDPFKGYDDIKEAMRDVPDDVFKLMLVHSPQVAREAAEAGTDLLLAGHTHGGQVKLPIFGVIYPHIPKHKKLVRGLFGGSELSQILKMDAGDMRVYTSRGIGISNLPIRFMCPPEIVLVTLRSANPQG